MRQLGWAHLQRLARVAAIVCAIGATAIATALAAPAAHQASGTSVSTHSTKLGTVLASARGHTLYLFAHDTGTSTCYGACAKAWPPLLTTARPSAAHGSGVKSQLLGTARRKDGRLQVTYKGHPLYSYSSDVSAGQSKGEGANQYGGHWYVLNTSGNAVKPKTGGGGATCNPLCPGY